MKKHLNLIFAAMLAALLLSGCKASALKEISVTSFKIVSLTPQGTTGVKALVEVGVHNPATDLDLSEVSGVLKVDGQQALVLAAEHIAIEGNTDKVYSLPFNAYLVDGYNPISVLRLLNSNLDSENLTVSMEAKVSLGGGPGKKIEISDRKLSDFIGTKKQ